ncbi:histidinol-phosphate transaminase [Robiginitalea marina]|uniref:Histidinol-phosphate aminotransferase n=1 Tax=Robiginitalea marina TaxID=2954105 RepID=A0ABT1AWJ0_9FLAO|nr:histidinol-phosphate transaminase [Robiginitalea marina]MCO5723568.1 histidinol-phosphate transaminase [Robiginitalea marina]
MRAAKTIAQLARPLIHDLKPYSSARDEYSGPGSGMVFLDANENPFESGVNRYPDPHQKALKEKVARLRGVSVGQVLLGNGSDEVLDLLFRVFCEPYRDAVITLPPTYGMYGVLAGINGVRNLEIPLNGDFQPDNPAIMEQAGEGVKMLFLCSPNNPSGNALERERVLELLDTFPGLVVIDEAYIDFAEDAGYAPLLENYPGLVVVQTLSKAYGMAGIRLGICLAGEEVISLLKRVKPPYNVNVLSQQRALAALSDPSAIAAQIRRLKGERSRLAGAFADLRMVEKVFPSQANFILARVDDAPARYLELLQAGIVVRDRSSQYLCENTLRFTVGTPEENDRLIAVLKQMDQIQKA